MKKTRCPLCFSDDVEELYRQKNIPVFNNIVYDNIKESEDCSKGTIGLAFCNNCSFVFNLQLNKKLLEYNGDYDNNRSFSDYYNKYTDNLIKLLIDKFQIKNKQILEIGSGDGAFLKSLCKQSDSNGIGFDPSYKGIKKIGNISFINDYFSKKYSKIKADIIVLRHLLEHIENPNKFLSNILHDITAKEHIIVLEVPDFDWILKHQAYWDITYEHCNYFTASSIKKLFNLKGITLVNIFNSFSGQYLIVIGKFGPTSINQRKQSILRGNCAKDIKDFIGNLKIKKNKINSKLDKIKKFTIWGISGKGVIFINMLDKKNLEKIPFVIDINKSKQGKYCPGTDKKIVAPTALNQDKEIKNIIIMNPNYYKEISQQLKGYGRKFNLIKI
jgi:hypothetical protein